MTDYEQPQPDDELLSRFLDGEVSPDERARVEADPGLRARLGSLSRAAEWVATPVDPPSEEIRERQLAAALAAREMAAETGTHGAAPTPLSAARSSRRARRWSVVAAAAVLLVLLPLGLVALRHNDDHDVSTVAAAVSSTTTAVTSPNPQAAADGAPSELSPASTTTAPATPRSQSSASSTDIGSYDSAAELQRALTTTTIEPTTTTAQPDQLATAAAPESPCLADVRANDPSIGTGTLVATAELGGTPVYIDSVDDPPLIVITAQNDCRELARFSR